MVNHLDQFNDTGYALFEYDQDLSDWADHAAYAAHKAALDKRNHALWMRSQDTWFVGVDSIPNTSKGRVNGSQNLSGAGADFCRNLVPDWQGFGQGQGSICYPDYPLPDANETPANHAYRVKRDSAHLDGLKPMGPKRRRHMDEFHAFIFGVPLNDVPKGASPFVIWKGSHKIIHQMLVDAYKGIEVENYHAVDLTDIYQHTRAHIFETCERVELQASQGECYVAHRFSLHGVAPWTTTQSVDPRGRMIAYFRPYWSGDLSGWLTL